MKEIRFDGRVAIVTGAGAGIGRAIAHLLAARGARVVVNDYRVDPSGAQADPDRAERVVSDIAQAGGEAIASAHPVGTRESAGAIARTVSRRTSSAPALMLEVWPQMARRRYGRILNMSSSGVFGLGGNTPDAVAKGGLLGLSLDTAQEGDGLGMVVNTLMPRAQAQMTAHRANAYLDTDFQPEKVAAIAAFLVSEEMTTGGMIFHSGGGLTARIASVRFRASMTRPRRPRASVRISQPSRTRRSRVL